MPQRPWTPPSGDDREPLPAITPIPGEMDRLIREKGRELAALRTDLKDDTFRAMLAELLVYRTRSFRREDPHG